MKSPKDKVKTAEAGHGWPVRRSLVANSTMPRTGKLAKRHRYWWLRLVLLVSCGGLLFITISIVIFLLLLPGVDDAEARVESILANHKATDTWQLQATKVEQAVIAIEDRRFYSHHGIDTIGLLHVAWINLTTPERRGGDTITQQLAKNLYVPDDHGLDTKLQTLGLAAKLEMRYTKAQILEMYLNVIYFGNGQWGMEQASRTYFKKPPEALDWAEASMLAGLPQAPSAYDPTRHFLLARQRQRQVFVALVRDEELSQTQAHQAYLELTDLGR